MKRFGAWLCLIAAALTFDAPLAGAAVPTVKDIGWAITNSNLLNSAQTAGLPQYAARRDVGGNIDTTGTFVAIPTGPSGLAAPPASAVAADTLNVGYIQIFSDSSVAVSNTLSSITYIVEGSGDGVTWSTAQASIVRTPVSGDVSFQIPVWIRTGVANTGAGISGNPWTAFPMYRIRVTASSGNFFAARCRYVYWSNQ